MRSLEQIVALMFVRPTVCLSGTGVHCDHTVHFNADLTLWLDMDSPMFWAPWHQSMSIVHLLTAVFFQFHLEERCVWMCRLGVISQERLKIEVKLLLSANIGSHYAESIGTTTDHLGWPWIGASSASRAISAVAELFTARAMLARY